MDQQTYKAYQQATMPCECGEWSYDQNIEISYAFF